MAFTLLSTLAALLAMMLMLWVIGAKLRDVSIVDVFWGCGFIAVAWISMAINDRYTTRMWLLTALVTLWGMRLACHLLLRRWGNREDRRYAAMREYHGPQFWWVSLVTVFMLQGAIIWFVSLPLQAAPCSIPAARWIGSML